MTKQYDILHLSFETNMMKKNNTSLFHLEIMQIVLFYNLSYILFWPRIVMWKCDMHSKTLECKLSVPPIKTKIGQS